MDNMKIPEEDYKKFIENMPICCIDLIIFHEGKVLLVKRKYEPEKGQWWVPGGRIYKNEKLKEAIIRKAKEETGIKIKKYNLSGAYDYMSNKSPFKDLKSGTHTPVIVFLVESIDSKVKIDETSSDYKWIDKIEEDLNPYLKKALEDSGVFN